MGVWHHSLGDLCSGPAAICRCSEPAGDQLRCTWQWAPAASQAKSREFVSEKLALSLKYSYTGELGDRVWTCLNMVFYFSVSLCEVARQSVLRSGL